MVMRHIKQYYHKDLLDGKGLKTSKSLGNTILPSDVEKQFGAEILRLWLL